MGDALVRSFLGVGRTRNVWGFWSNLTFALVTLAAGAVGVLSLGFLHTSWEMGFARWRTQREFAKQKRNFK